MNSAGLYEVPLRTARYHSIPALFMTVAALFLIGTLFLHAQTREALGDYEVSGPYHHGNLTVFLIHGRDHYPDRAFLPLEKAMEQGLVRVYETGEVNELAIENLSPDKEVYVQAGDIVKGGRQDRTLGADLVLAPQSGRVPIPSFCVESGRWTRRGDESDRHFSSSKAVVTSNELRLAIREEKDQSKVWQEVSTVQKKISDNIGVRVNAIGDVADTVFLANANVNAANVRPSHSSASAPVRVYEDRDVIVQSQMNNVNQVEGIYNLDRNVQTAHGGSYTTSLQLSLENEELAKEIDEYIASLQGVIDGHDDVIGFAFTVNGTMRNADIYGSGQLFRDLWPKLLKAAAAEALAHKVDDENLVAGTYDEVQECFLDAEKAESSTEHIGENMKLVKHKSQDNVLFESGELREEGRWLHRNYMSLE